MQEKLDGGLSVSAMRKVLRSAGVDASRRGVTEKSEMVALVRSLLAGEGEFAGDQQARAEAELLGKPAPLTGSNVGESGTATQGGHASSRSARAGSAGMAQQPRPPASDDPFAGL